ncbi:hypothetical protein [Streptomyces sp. NBC_01190]|uniref:hypothetical protein n=1 Tax=Streptomyces sp. NBC_01190 TaxID=2903767 RepID=UPI003867F5BE|nr:hypothetical protein OG519_02530 [Streptomyces sp. NBC_01190]
MDTLGSGTPPRVVGRRRARRLRPMPKEQQELVLREWAVLRERLRRHASARLADAGDALRAGELDLPQGNPGARDYSWALEAYQAAGKLLDEAVDLPDLAAVVVLAERAVERLAVARARGAGHRPGAVPERCFYNPLHPAARRPPEPGGRRARGRVSARRAAADRRPACASCYRALLAGQQPDVLPALIRVRVSFRRTVPVLVPYYMVPQQFSPWSATACGAYDDDAPGLVMSGEHRTRSVMRH